MFDEFKKEIMKENLINSFPEWIKVAINSQPFEKMFDCFLNFLESFSDEKKQELVFHYDNFLHYCQFNEKIINSKIIFEHKKNVNFKYKTLYLNDLNNQTKELDPKQNKY